MSGISILINDSHGVFIPQVFAESYEGWKNIDEESAKILSAGPDHEWYWETWEEVTSKATWTDKSGNLWRLWQDGDLFAYCEELMTDEEKTSFFGGC